MCCRYSGKVVKRSPSHCAAPSLSQGDVDGFAERFDFARYRTVCDVGGGHGPTRLDTLLALRVRNLASESAIKSKRLDLISVGGLTGAMTTAGRTVRTERPAPPRRAILAAAERLLRRARHVRRVETARSAKPPGRATTPQSATTSAPRRPGARHRAETPRSRRAASRANGGRAAALRRRGGRCATGWPAWCAHSRAISRIWAIPPGMRALRRRR